MKGCCTHTQNLYYRGWGVAAVGGESHLICLFIHYHSLPFGAFFFFFFKELNRNTHTLEQLSLAHHMREH